MVAAAVSGPSALFVLQQSLILEILDASLISGAPASQPEPEPRGDSKVSVQHAILFALGTMSIALKHRIFKMIHLLSTGLLQVKQFPSYGLC
jgi:hypothetical protein